jgi:hypothetical protein
MKKVRKKSAFAEELAKGAKKHRDNNLPEESRKLERYAKLESYFNDLGDKTNRYLFYCPDIPFACSLVKVIYEHVSILKNLGYNAQIIHEVKGYKPNWLISDTKKNIEPIYLSEKTSKGTFTKPSFIFSPTDTVIVPDGFWSVMQGFSDTKTLHKVVMAFGYGGLATAEPGTSWSALGFTDVICMSEKIKEDYSKIWPELNYHTTGYIIDEVEFTPIAKSDIQPTISLSCRSREDAQSLINIFYGRYPFLDMFQFKVLKRLDTRTYAEVLRNSAINIFIDEKAGHPAPPLEGIAASVPTLAVYGRGMEHLINQKGIIWCETNDLFAVVENLGHFCLNWLENNVEAIVDKTILNDYQPAIVSSRILSVFTELQGHKVKLFASIKTAVDEGKLSETALDSMSADFKDVVVNPLPAEGQVTTVDNLLKAIK